MPKAVKPISTYEDLARLMREIQLTAGAVASYLETRSDSLPFSSDWMGSRLDYLELKLQTASDENDRFANKDS